MKKKTNEGRNRHPSRRRSARLTTGGDAERSPAAGGDDPGGSGRRAFAHRGSGGTVDLAAAVLPARSAGAGGTRGGARAAPEGQAAFAGKSRQSCWKNSSQRPIASAPGRRPWSVSRSGRWDWSIAASRRSRRRARRERTQKAPADRPRAEGGPRVRSPGRARRRSRQCWSSWTPRSLQPTAPDGGAEEVRPCLA